MIRRRRLRVQWFLTILCTLGVSATFIYKNIVFVKEFNKPPSIEYNLPRKVLLSVGNTRKISTSTSTEMYVGKLSTANVRKKYVTKSMAQLGKMDEISKHFLFLNSVPKSGSEILIFLLEKIQGFNNFKHIRLKEGNVKKLTRLQQENLIEEIYETRRTMAIPLSFDRNVYFVNFTTLDKQSPTYINLIRDPVAKVMARAILPKTGTYDSYFMGCLAADSKRNCNFKDGRPYDLTIPYFCGHDTRCMLLNNEWAFETAKKNVEQYYQVVGVLEELDLTLDVLERKVPQFFNGAKIAYQQNLLDIYKHKKEPKIPDNVRKSLEQTLTKELEFYHWVRDRLLGQTNFLIRVV